MIGNRYTAVLLLIAWSITFETIRMDLNNAVLKLNQKCNKKFLQQQVNWSSTKEFPDVYKDLEYIPDVGCI